MKNVNLWSSHGGKQTMKNRTSLLVTFAFVFLLLAADWSFGQRDFHMTERKLVDKFKMADAKFQKGKGLFILERKDKQIEKLENENNKLLKQLFKIE